MNESQALVKVFISSRENMDIVARLENTPNVRIGAKENTEDIANFVHHQLKVANLLNGRLPAFLKEKIPETLIEGAQGMLRWVDLQIQSLRSLKVAVDIEANLGRLPRSLEESYSEILEQIEASGEHAFKLASLPSSGYCMLGNLSPLPISHSLRHADQCIPHPSPVSKSWTFAKI